jgi:hypothetical protein
MLVLAVTLEAQFSSHCWYWHFVCGAGLSLAQAAPLVSSAGLHDAQR